MVETAGRLSGRWSRLGQRAAKVALVLLAVSGFLTSCVPAGRTVYRTAVMLPNVLTNSQGGLLTLSGSGVRHTQELLSGSSGQVYLDIFAPVGAPPSVPGSRAGILIIAGVGDNRSDASLINLALSLAHSGVVVMTMVTPSLINWALTPDDVDGVVQATQRLARWPGVSADRVGLLGISAGGALMCLAAADPRLQEKIAFLTLFGGYYDATSFLRDLGRRALEVDGKLVAWSPQDVPLYVLATSLAPTLPRGEAAAFLAAYGVGGTAYQSPPSGLAESQLATLSPGTQALYHLLAGDEPGQVEANLTALTPATKAGLRLLSPSSVVSQLHTHVYLLHDTSDQYVPFTESRDFDQALTRLGKAHDFVEISIFQHVELRSGNGPWPIIVDGARLYGLLFQILQVAA